MSKSVILIGFKACGKTAVGEMIAQKMGVDFVDTDRLLVARYSSLGGEQAEPLLSSSGLSAGSSDVIDCAAIYRSIGQQAFRDLEKAVLIDLQQTAVTTPRVIATGGGIVLDLENRAILQQLGQVIYLSASLATLLSRLKTCPQPAFMSGDLETELKILFAQREPIYRDMAEIILDTKQYSVTEVVALYLSKYGSGMTA